MAALAIFAGVGVFCWLLYNAAIYTLPFLVGAFAGLHAERAGAGPLDGIVLGFGAGVLVLIVGRALFALAREPVLRIAIAIVCGPSRARSLFCDVHALRLGFDFGRMASGPGDHWGDGSWHHRRAKTCRNATACQR